MITYTFDHNAIIDLEEKREPRRSAICKILNSHFEQCGITAVSASENPPIKNFAEFKLKIVNIPEFRNIKDCQILKPMGIFDFTFYDWGVFGDGPGQPMVTLKEDITNILFPNFIFKELDAPTRNKLADIMTFWCHIYYKRNIFITSDNNFHRKANQLKRIALNYSGNSIEIHKPTNFANYV